MFGISLKPAIGSIPDTPKAAENESSLGSIIECPPGRTILALGTGH